MRLKAKTYSFSKFSNNLRLVKVVLILVLSLLLAGCYSQTANKKSIKSNSNKPVARRHNTIILATTTSTYDTGLLDELIPMFEKKYPQYQVKPIAVGTGEALAMGSRGDADILIVHAPKAERQFMKKKNGIRRRYLMYNQFVIVGPKNDPAKIDGLINAVAAFKEIAKSKARFISRDDNSGTNKKEISIWNEALIVPDGSWYLKTGQGMASTLRIADQKKAYTLTDIGTFMTVKKSVSLKILATDKKRLKNPYHLIEVNPAKFSRVNNRGAHTLASFFLSSPIQRKISEFGEKKYGRALFFIKS